MGRTVTVRVVPRSMRAGIDEGVLTIRVRAAPEGGKATEEAALALANHLGIPRTSVRLRAGARSRTKLFDLRETAP